MNNDLPGSILEIHIADSGAPPRQQTSVSVEVGKGIPCDRYYLGTGTFSARLQGQRKSEITFIAAEEIDRFNAAVGESFGYGDVRRNVVTRGLELGNLIGKEFTIGDARFLGIERCEPCAHLASTVHPKVLPHLVHTGLRAAILESGTIAPGNAIVIG